MNHKIPVLFLSAIVLMFASACNDGIKVWVEPSTERVMMNTPAGSDSQAFIYAARNEYESFQVVVRGGLKGLKDVNVAATDLTGPGDAFIPKENITMFREYYVKVNSPSFLGGVVGNLRLPGNYPDPLIPFFDPYDSGHPAVGAPFDITRLKNQPVWIDVYVPEETPAGSYTGKLEITAAGKNPVYIDLNLTVWDFSIPRERTIATSYGLLPGSVPQYHPQALTAEAKNNYEQELHRHRIDSFSTAGMLEYPFVFGSDGHLLPVDWSNYDAVMGPRLDGSFYNDGVPLYRFNAGFFYPGGTGWMETSLTDEQYKEAAKEFARHLKEKGWMDRVYMYVLDEPFINAKSYDVVANDIKLILEADPDWKGAFLVTNWWVKDLEDTIDIWCPEVTKYDDWFLGAIGVKFAGREQYAKMLADGRELWFYVCLATVPPYPGYDIDTMIGYEPRILMWGSWYEGATGFLYWSTMYWVKDDPWGKLKDPVTFPVSSRNGDGFLFYPGDHNGTLSPAGSPHGISINGPITSIRLKQTRDGLEDWEMFKMASSAAGVDAVKACVSRAYTQMGTAPVLGLYNPLSPPWTYDGKVLNEVRKEVAGMIINNHP
ncbi:MAG TPA: glycoside hydrolase domain-containing protein [Desulfomonilia bacterium]